MASPDIKLLYLLYYFEETLMKVKHPFYLLPLAVSTMFSTCALATVQPLPPPPPPPPLDPVDIRFEGTITASVCTPELSGPSVTGTTVTLPPAPTEHLANTGDVFGETPFTITVTCPTKMTLTDNMPVHFRAHFEGTSVNSEGRFETQSGSSRVSFQLLDGPGGAVIAAGGAYGDPNQGSGSDPFSGNPPAVSASKEYAVQYYAEAGLTNLDAGTVSADGTYTVYFH